MRKIKNSLCAFLLVFQTMNLLFAADNGYYRPNLKPPENNKPVTSSRNITSEEALKRLVEGNRRFAADQITCDDRNNLRRAALLSKQNPFAIVLGCADSRIPVEILFDQGVGDLFVVRVAGNVAGNSEIESVEYAIKHLDASLIVVLGHEQCAAVASVLHHDAADIPEIASLIEPALRPTKNGTHSLNIEQAVKANVRLVVDTLKHSPLLTSILEKKKMMVVGGYYHLESGLVEFL